MKQILDPNDWLGRHENTCLLLIAVLVVIGGSL
jgi:hypothetical protein